MQAAHAGTSEVAIFGRMLDADQSALTIAAAQNILEFGFAEDDKERMRLLSAKAKRGMLTDREQEEINNYEKVGHMLSLMKSKARRLLESGETTHGMTAH